MSDPGRAFDDLLEHLQATRGFDFTAYKRTGLERRIRKRMEARGLETFAAYRDLLQAEPDEYDALFDAILINLTGFFRDPERWEELRRDVLPAVLAAAGPDGAIRVWSAGCSSGEEAYTLAMVLAEGLGEEAFLERVKIYATDLDRSALSVARAGIYPHEALEAVPQELRERYFVGGPGVDGLQFRPGLRRSLIFGHHDLLDDPPISNLDLLVCRNTLMYLNPEAQGQVLGRFHFALKSTGYLFVGRAEMLLTQTDLFLPTTSKGRIFRVAPQPTPREDVFGARRSTAGEQGMHEALRDLGSDLSPVPQVVLDADRNLLQANQAARQAFGIRRDDIGRPFQELEISYRPVNLGSTLDEAFSAAQQVSVPEVQRRTQDGEDEFLSIAVSPLLDPTGEHLGATIAFQDVTRYRRLRDDLERSNQDLETAYEELQSSNEELETTNEELQSTVEELETVNEELQSSNEELETVNEELQSANEELHGVNEELQARTEELGRSETFLASVLASLHPAVIVCDRDLLVRVWNPRAEELWGARSVEVRDQPLFSLDIGLEFDEELRDLIASCSAGGSAKSLVRNGTNRRGKPIEVRLECTPLRGPERTSEGVILLIMEAGEGSDG